MKNIKNISIFRRIASIAIILVMAFTMFSGAIPSAKAAESFEETLTNQMYKLSGWGYDFVGSGIPDTYNPMKATLSYKVGGVYPTISQGMTNPAFRQAYSRSWFSYWKDGKGRTCYCTQLGIDHNDSKQMQKVDFNEPATISKFYNTKTISLLNNASIYTYKLPAGKTSLPLTSKENCKYGYTWDVELVASQYIVWAISSNRIFDSSYETTYLNCVIAPNSTKKAQFKECYKKMKADILGHGDIPKGMAETKKLVSSKETCTLTYNPSTGKWVGKIASDANLSLFTATGITSNTNVIKFTRNSDNSLTVEASPSGYQMLTSSPVEFVKTKAKYASKMDSCAPLLYATAKDPNLKAGSQAKIGFYDHADPVKAYVAFKGNVGGVTVTKSALDAENKSTSKTYVVTSTKNPSLNSAVTFKLRRITSSGSYYVNGVETGSTRKYTFTQSNATSVGGTFRLDANGKFTITGLPAGKYEIIETCKDPNYKAPAKNVTFTVTSGNTTSASVVNTEKSGNVSIYKVIDETDANGKKIAATSDNVPELNSAVRFKIQLKGTNKYITANMTSTKASYIYSGENATGTEFIVNNNAHFYIKNVPDGEYVLIETKTASGYSLADPVSFTVKDGEKYENSIVNEKKVGNLHIIKKITVNGHSEDISTFNNYDALKEAIRFKVKDYKTGLYVDCADISTSSDVTKNSGRYNYTGLSKTGTSLVLAAGKTNDSLAKGEILIENLPEGTYVIVESEANKGDFEALGLKRSINLIVKIQKGETTDKPVTNKLTVPGSLTVNKDIVLADSSEVVTQEMYDACSFTIINKNGKYVKATLSSADDGEYASPEYVDEQADATVFKLGTNTHTFTVSGLEVTDSWGLAEHYTIHEDVPINFTCESNDISASIDAAKETEVTFKNVENSGSLTIEKHTEGDENISGIGFIVVGTTDSDEAFSKRVVTNQKGEAYIAKIPCGSYEVYEDASTVPAGYAVADSQTITIKLNENTTTSFFNKKLTATLSIVKSSEDEEHLEGIEFNVEGPSLADKSTVYGKGVTDNSGKAVVYLTNADGEYILDDKGNKIDNIPLGEKFVVSENPNTVHYGYFTADSKTISLIEGSKAEEVQFHNTLKHADIALIKVDADNHETKLAGAEFTIYEDSDENGEFGESDRALEILNDNGDGTYKSNALKLGTYFIKETKAPDGFIADETVYKVSLMEDSETYTVKNSDDGTFVNTPIKSKAEVIKLDRDNHEIKLAGAEFAVYKDSDDSGVYDESDEFVGTMTDLGDGRYESEELRMGRYFVKETKVPAGYVLDEGYYEVNVKTNGETISVENVPGVGFVESPEEAKISVLKFDKNYPENKLSGAEFSVYEDTNGDGEYTEGADELVQILEEVSEGYYESAKLRLGTYFVRETKAPSGYSIDKNVYTAELDEYGKTYSIENIEGKGFANAPTEFEFTKTDYVNGAPLPDCGIRIFNSKNELVFEGYTDSEGKIVLTGLNVGKYYYQEFDAPEGYLIDEGTYPFEIKDDGVVVKCELKDKREPAMDIDTPQTGKETDYTIPAILAGVAGLALALAVVFTKKKKD